MSTPATIPLEQSITGCIIGTAVGDAMGLPYEGISRRRQHKMFPRITGHRLVFKWGMISDDAEHICMTALALIASGGNATLFARSLSRRLRFWLLGLPAGVGFATLRAILKSSIGYSPANSGVFSAGNGPCMRSAIIGAAYGQDPDLMCELVRASTRITHTDPRAEHGAIAVALAAWTAGRNTSDQINCEEYLATLAELLEGQNAEEMVSLIRRAVLSASAGDATQQFADSLGLQNAVTGFVNHTVPVVIHTWLRHQRDYEVGVLEIIRCGGDTDTTAAILGGIIGARAGVAGIPPKWIDDLMEWPRSITWMQQLSRRLLDSVAHPGSVRPARLFFPAIALRNIFFLIVVLLHGLRRMLPPY